MAGSFHIFDNSHNFPSRVPRAITEQARLMAGPVLHADMREGTAPHFLRRRAMSPAREKRERVPVAGSGTVPLPDLPVRVARLYWP